MTKILVTGGAGYIGSHTIIDLISAGYDVVSVDNFINSSVETFSKIKEITDKTVTNFAADLCDYEKLEEVFQKNKFAEIPLLVFHSHINPQQNLKN